MYSYEVLNDLQSVRKDTSHDSSKTIRTVPTRHSDRLLGSPIPLRSDDGEERQATSFEQAEEEPRRVDALVTFCRAHAGRRTTPSKDEECHERSRWDSHDEVGREWLPAELGDSVNGTGEAVVRPVLAI